MACLSKVGATGVAQASASVFSPFAVMRRRVQEPGAVLALGQLAVARFRANGIRGNRRIDVHRVGVNGLGADQLVGSQLLGVVRGFKIPCVPVARRPDRSTRRS